MGIMTPSAALLLLESPTGITKKAKYLALMLSRLQSGAHMGQQSSLILHHGYS